jgi:hypothetical protein
MPIPVSRHGAKCLAAQGHTGARPSFVFRPGAGSERRSRTKIRWSGAEFVIGSAMTCSGVQRARRATGQCRSPGEMPKQQQTHNAVMRMCANRHRHWCVGTCVHAVIQAQQLRYGGWRRVRRTRIVMPGRIRDLALAALGAALLVGALALIDQRVPAHVAGVARHVSSGEWRAPGSVVDNLLADVTGSAAANDVFLFSMVAAGIVLVILMVRT